VAEVSAGNDVITDDSFVQSATSAFELRNECCLLPVAASTIFSTPLAQSVKHR